MNPDQSTIYNSLKTLLLNQVPPLIVRQDEEGHFEVAGTKPVMQGKQKVDGHYFASLVLKPKDVRFYFFPIYTHVDQFELSPQLKKFLKGKSCFHIKKLNDVTENELKKIIEKGIELYQKEDWI